MERVLPVAGAYGLAENLSKKLSQLHVRREKQYLGLILVDKGLIIFWVLEVSEAGVSLDVVDDIVRKDKSYQENAEHQQHFH